MDSTGNVVLVQVGFMGPENISACRNDKSTKVGLAHLHRDPKPRLIRKWYDDQVDRFKSGLIPPTTYNIHRILGPDGFPFPLQCSLRAAFCSLSTPLSIT